jgi:hypothetical protein
MSACGGVLVLLAESAENAEQVSAHPQDVWHLFLLLFLKRLMNPLITRG